MVGLSLLWGLTLILSGAPSETICITESDGTEINCVLSTAFTL